jgi:hypothetical protein
MVSRKTWSFCGRLFFLNIEVIISFSPPWPNYNVFAHSLSLLFNCSMHSINTVIAIQPYACKHSTIDRHTNKFTPLEDLRVITGLRFKGGCFWMVSRKTWSFQDHLFFPNIEAIIYFFFFSPLHLAVYTRELKNFQSLFFERCMRYLFLCIIYFFSFHSSFFSFSVL